MDRQSQPAAKRRGRPSKFGRPSRVVALTLPEDAIDRLRRVHRDLGWAIVNVLEKAPHARSPRGDQAQPDVELVTVSDRRALIVVNREVIRNLPGVNIIPLSGTRAFLALDIDRGMSDLELAVTDRLGDPALERRERRALEELRAQLTTWRRDGELQFHTRAIIVVERRVRKHLMNSRVARFVCALLLIVAAGACSSGTPAQPSTRTTPPPPAPAPIQQIVISAPTLVSPLNGAAATGWPTFTVNNAVRSGPAGPLVYRFEVSTSADFSTITVTGTVPETPNQTSFTPPSSQTPPPQGALFWRAVAIDPVNVVSSPLSAVQSFTSTAPPTVAATLAAQEGAVLWPGAQPPGTSGHAILGDFWNVQTLRSYDGITFISPELEELRVFDLLDRGLDPQGAIDWMHSNGYPTIAAYFPSVAVIGFRYEYMALINGRWDLVLRVGA